MSKASKFHNVPAGKIAAVITYLEMFSRPPPSALPPPAPNALLWKVEQPELEWYLDLFRRIGEDFLWFSRVTLAEDALTGIIQDPLVEICALNISGAGEGLMEPDFRQEGQYELALIGLTPGFTGTGTGRWLMAQSIDLAWSRPIKRFWVHTCTPDHPGALQFYMRS